MHAITLVVIYITSCYKFLQVVTASRLEVLRLQWEKSKITPVDANPSDSKKTNFMKVESQSIEHSVLHIDIDLYVSWYVYDINVVNH